MSITLYYHPLSSFCHKVLIALYENNVAFVPRIIDFRDEVGQAELQVIWPFNKFPVIRDEGRQRDVAESSIIIEYLDHYFAGTHTLIPADWETALDVRFWDRVFDNYVQRPLQAIVADRIKGANADLSAEYATLKTAYGLIDRRMASKVWISGQHFSLADCAAAPALFYSSTLQPFPAECEHLRAYFDRLVKRPSVLRVIEEAKPYFSLYPFADRIPQRFR
ncbi:MAG: glutathione S-transferase family protein [Burkholderiales bacterium]|nr:MAG: glutathione S-transferase family protein [Betaproteobacteria bacterium]TAG83937.1 MAG: glutathione S-transferase family protein [Burkholderiales bacterium]